MIKLTTKDGEPYWVNPALMTGMFPQDGGTRLCFIFPDDSLNVKEKPEEINQAIEKHAFKEIRYKEKLAHLTYAYSSGKKCTAANFGLEGLTKEHIKDALDELASINAPLVEKIIEDNALENVKRSRK